MPARSKSFTGCWTCRARKIKCDLQQPECKQCLKANLKCAGYDIKLRWTGEGADPGNDRRKVEFVQFPAHMMYDTYEELDDKLTELHNSSLIGEETKLSGPFGIFQGPIESQGLSGVGGRRRQKRGKINLIVRTRSQEASREVSPASVSPAVGGMGLRDVTPALGPGSAIQRPYLDDPSFVVNPYVHSHQAPQNALYSHNEFKSLQGIEEDLLSFFPETYMGAVSADPQHQDVLFSQIASGMPAQHVPQDEIFTMGCSPTFLAQSRYLLWHYKHYVTPIMTYIIHPKNPWRTIYLPRAYAAIGDIASGGHTSSERYTLLHSFLATSAYHIRNKFVPGSPGHQFYTELAAKLERVAKSWLSQCLHSDTVGKYKDFLVALLSMVTLDLVRGQESTVDVPLGAAQRLITLRYQKRPKMSRKACILHRICVMLTLLQKATIVDRSMLDAGDGDHGDLDAWMDKTFDDVVIPQNSTLAIQKLEQLESRQMPLSYMSDQIELEEYFNQYQDFQLPVIDQIDAIPDDYEAVSTQLIHGVPDSLVYVFKEVVRVSREALRQRERDGHTEFSHELSSACTQVEAALASWKSQFEASRPTDLLVSQVNEAVMHHALAFHEALVVYHYRMAKDVNRTLLQPVIERVLEHLESITKLNGDNVATPVALPFLFAGFICGCEVTAENKSLRTRYDLWFRDMRASGLSTYETAISVVSEVNERRMAGAPSNWWEILRERGVSLTLI